MNTKILYMYRDASNYKILQDAVIEGELSEEQQEDILNARYDGLWFLPSAVGLDEERFSDETDDDHPWFELFDDAFETIDDLTTTSLTAQEFYDNFMEVSQDWEAYAE